jgi:hypothetical protein
MYPTVLLLHSWLRWAVIILGLLAIVRAAAGVKGRRDWRPADEAAGRWFVIAFDVQFLLGLVLFFLLSPITKAVMADFGGAMGVSTMRYWAVEHWFGMLVGIAFAHAGRAKARKLTDPVRRHKTLLLFFTLALLAVLISIPWPGTPTARPLFRW